MSLTKLALLLCMFLAVSGQGIDFFFNILLRDIYECVYEVIRKWTS